MRDELIKDVYFGAYQHIGFSFMEKIIDERIISVNMGALHQMSLGMVPNYRPYAVRETLIPDNRQFRVIVGFRG